MAKATATCHCFDLRLYIIPNIINSHVYQVEHNSIHTRNLYKKIHIINKHMYICHLIARIELEYASLTSRKVLTVQSMKLKMITSLNK